MAFSKEQSRQRIERFTSYMDKQEGITCRVTDIQEGNKRPYIVFSSTELAIITFTSNGGVQLTAYAGQLKELVLAWVTYEVCPCHDSSHPGELAKLDSYRYLLSETDTANDPQAFPPPGALRLTPQDNTLVELAGLLGYDVYLLVPSGPTSSRYGIATQQEIIAQGDLLVQVLAQLITGHPAEAVDDLVKASAPGRIYLSKNIKHPLAYWRKHTELHGVWMTQQILADLAGLDVHTVQRAERERRPSDHAHVYLSTAKSIIAALNGVREQQRMSLLQLWNIDWAPEPEE